MTHDNLEQIVKMYVKAVKTLRASRAIRDANIEIVEKYALLEANKINLPANQRRTGVAYKTICRDYGEVGKQVLKALTRITESKWALGMLRPTIRLVQAIKHDRLSTKEKEVLLDFLSNPRDMNVPFILLGLSVISSKLLAEVLCKQLYKNI